MKVSAFALSISALVYAGNSLAHVGVANNTLPISAAGQAAFTVANTSSEIVFIVGHGCNGEAEPKPPANLDTTKIDITVPAAIVTATGAASVRPSHQGEFGNVTRKVNEDGSIKFTWTKVAAPTADDDQLYKVSIRLKTPAATSASDFAIKKYQFLATQTCAVPGAADYVLDWGSANSPWLLSFPEKRKGFNKYTLDATTLGDFAVTGSNTKAAKLKSYFGDAAIVWVGKRAYSPNAITSDKVDQLAKKDLTYSNLGTETGVSLSADETIWVRY
ncbi:MAG TPA: hypothetical protein PKE57_01870 [Cellvibrionaceae bacterium]|nr:hypothetical protein [Cellvibrionaceae bacterium]HMW73443.1 hypothetical protein [Cellvibrionaceae bacterium]HMY38345.1 hypothetical protein [Marinagarivorans sp.]